MRQYNFTEEARKQIAFERYHHPNPRVLQRMEILALKMHGQTHQQIAQMAGVTRATVRRVLRVFATQGLSGVRTFHEKGPTSSLKAHEVCLETEFREHPPQTVDEARDRIEQLTGIRRKRTQVRKFLHDTLGLHWRKVAAIPVPPKKSVAEHAATQAAFLKDSLGAALG
jgi:transposase